MTDPTQFPSPRSAASVWSPLRRFVAREEALGRLAMRRGRIWHFAYEFVRFGVKQAWACLFGAVMLALIVLTYLVYPKGAALARYDLLVLAALALQATMVLFKLETSEEVRVIFLFHAVGTIMEIFKTAVGSWAYPEPSLLRIGGVPLFTGFMYAAVGSYMTRAWRLFHFEFTRHPPVWTLGLLSIAIYVNFFTHHYVWDTRPLLFAAAVLLFGPCTIHYKIWRVHRRMPLLAGLLLVALFIWFAENLGTFASAWIYPHQKSGWSPVHISKLGAWFLLMTLSYTMVALLHGISAHATALPRPRAATTQQPGNASV